MQFWDWVLKTPPGFHSTAQRHQRKKAVRMLLFKLIPQVEKLFSFQPKLFLHHVLFCRSSHVRHMRFQKSTNKMYILQWKSAKLPKKFRTLRKKPLASRGQTLLTCHTHPLNTWQVTKELRNKCALHVWIFPSGVALSQFGSVSSTTSRLPNTTRQT